MSNPNDPTWYVFNLDQPLAGSNPNDVSYLVSNDPVVALRGGVRFPRTPRQVEALAAVKHELTLAPDKQPNQLGLDLNTAYRLFIVHRSDKPRDPQEPLGNEPSAIVSAADRAAHMSDAQQAIDTAITQDNQQTQELVALCATIEKRLKTNRPEKLKTDLSSLHNRLVGSSSYVLYLFNVIVAVEWTPDSDYLNRLTWAFRQASDLLYDVTNGHMAFGQVIFGDRSWLGCADVQIMASNRFLPRSWVRGLVEDPKYMPIRAGRGIWDKSAQRAIHWNEYLAFSALAHEWGHYALNLQDTYVTAIEVEERGHNTKALIKSRKDKNNTAGGSSQSAPTKKIAVPQVQSKIDSIMATPNGSSELSALDVEKIDPDHIFYPGLDISKQFPGPNQSPLPFPSFHIDETLKGGLPKYSVKLPNDLALVNKPCWVYAIDQRSDGTERIIAQGSRSLDFVSADKPTDTKVENRTLSLYGVSEGNTIVVIGEDDRANLTTWSGKLPKQPDKTSVTWDAAPPHQWPIITIEPDAVEDPTSKNQNRTSESNVGPLQANANDPSSTPSNQGQLKAGVKIKVHRRPAHNEPASDGSRSTSGPTVKVFPIGSDASLNEQDLQTPKEVSSLDGHIVIYNEQEQPIMINPYSQGGGPASSPNVPRSPITAGSADGEALLFFDTDTKVTPADKKKYARVRVVTTTLPILPVAPPQDAIQLSSAFGIVSNQALPQDLSPTLVILTDSDQIDGLDVFIHQLDMKTNQWTRLHTFVQPSRSFVAAPLDADTAPGLLKKRAGSSFVDYFCLFAVQRQPDGAAKTPATAEAAATESGKTFTGKQTPDLDQP